MFRHKRREDGCESYLDFISSDSTGGKCPSVPFNGFSQILVTDTLTVLCHTLCSISTENMKLSSFFYISHQRFIFKTYASSISHYHHRKIQDLDILRDIQEVPVFVTLVPLGRYRKYKILNKYKQI